jgi:hypothetical protein
MSIPVPAVATPWYKSQVLRGVAIVVVTRILARFHIQIPGVDAGDIVDTLMDLGTLAGAALVAYGRVSKPNLPIVASQAKADAAAVVAAVSPPASPVSQPPGSSQP